MSALDASVAAGLLTHEDAQALRRHLPQLTGVTPGVTGNAEMQAGGRLRRALVYGGHYPSSLLDQVEAGAVAAAGEYWVYENICRRFGDSGGLNPLLALQRHAERKAATADTPPALLSLSDSQGGTWLLRGE